MDRKVYFPLSTLAVQRGGLVKAVRERASFLAASGADVTLLTLAGQSALDVATKQAREAGQLHAQVKTVDLLHALGETRGRGLRAEATHARPGEVAFRVSGQHAIRVFGGGVYLRYVRFFDAQLTQPEVVEHFGADRKRFLREEFDGTGRLRQRVDYRADAKIAATRRFFDASGECFLTVWCKPGTGEWGQTHLHSRGLRFARPIDLYTFALEEYLRQIPAATITSEFRDELPQFGGATFDDAIAGVNHPNLRKIAVAHNVHRQGLGTHSLPVRRPWARLFELSAEFDAFVTWTASQAGDMKKLIPASVPVLAAPIVAPAGGASAEVAASASLAMVARIVPQKRIDQAVDIISVVHKTRPDVRLKIFGFGHDEELKARLRAQIDELGLQNVVTFEGFKENSDQIYEGVRATLMTSEHEGLGLVVMESMAHGVPVVAYDCNYGPADMISDGIDGFLVPFGDVSLAAKRVLALLGDDDQHSRMSHEASARVARQAAIDPSIFWTDLLIEGPTRESQLHQCSASLRADERLLPAPPYSDLTAAEGVFTLSRVRGDERRLELVSRTGDDVPMDVSEGPDGWTLKVQAPASRNGGAIIDVNVIEPSGKQYRARFLGQESARSDCPGGTWRAYGTVHGYLSLKWTPTS